jgi:hypothetical protein
MLTDKNAAKRVLLWHFTGTIKPENHDILLVSDSKKTASGSPGAVLYYPISNPWSAQDFWAGIMCHEKRRVGRGTRRSKPLYGVLE